MEAENLSPNIQHESRLYCVDYKDSFQNCALKKTHLYLKTFWSSTIVPKRLELKKPFEWI